MQNILVAEGGGVAAIVGEKEKLRFGENFIKLAKMH